MPMLKPLAKFAGAGCVGLLVGVGVAAAMGGVDRTLLVCGGVLMVVGLIGCLPAIFASQFPPARFGLFALGGSMLQTLFAAGLIVGAASIEGVERKSMAMGACCGSFLMLMMSALIAVRAINTMPPETFGAQSTKPSSAGPSSTASQS